MQKSEAIALLGGSVAAVADAIGVTYQAVDKWPDELPPRIADRVQAALWRMTNRASGAEADPVDPAAPFNEGEPGGLDNADLPCRASAATSRRTMMAGGERDTDHVSNFGVLDSPEPAEEINAIGRLVGDIPAKAR